MIAFNVIKKFDVVLGVVRSEVNIQRMYKTWTPFIPVWHKKDVWKCFTFFEDLVCTKRWFKKLPRKFQNTFVFMYQKYRCSFVSCKQYYQIQSHHPEKYIFSENRVSCNICMLSFIRYSTCEVSHWAKITISMRKKSNMLCFKARQHLPSYYNTFDMICKFWHTGVKETKMTLFYRALTIHNQKGS